MRIRSFWVVAFLFTGLVAYSQSFEWVDRSETINSSLSQNIKIPIKIKNNSDKAQFYIVRIVGNELSGTQKGYFCLDKNCLESSFTEVSKRVEAGATLEDFHFNLETGLVVGQFPIKFEVFVKGNIQTLMEHQVNVVIDEKQPKSLAFHSKDITVHEVYPNPIFDQAFIDYRLHNENAKARLTVHNILGSSLSNHDLPYSESKVKIDAGDMTPGVYFYTVYIDNIGILTRKLIVRK
jgi:Secretion system C-terminal sorting domain